ncbi:MAG: ECF transporter S component, partial [Firmicutes bacterium]|nr:ECF transporter S component [Bacillota bacterium]
MSLDKQAKSNKQIYNLCIAALFLGLNIAASSVGIPVPGGHFYLNDVVICTAALLLNPLYATLVGGVGAFLGDVFFY